MKLHALPPPKIPLSRLDKISLSDSKESLAQRYYETTLGLAQRCDIQGFAYHASPGLSNLDEISKLWMLQAREGKWTDTLASIPATAFTGAAGALGGTPIEGAEIQNGRLVGASATGHGFNPVLNGLSAIALGIGVSGVAGQFSPLMIALGAVGPLLTAAPLLVQATTSANAPVHELAHAMQFLVLGDMLNRKILDSSDLVAIQNDQGATGYLWGGQSERAAREAETSGDPSPLFEVLRERCRERLAHRPQQLSQAETLLDAHAEWVKQKLAATST